SDNAVYNEVKDLLKKDVVSFEKSRGDDDDLFQLEHAYGSHGAQLVQKIKNAGKIIFHAFGDSGASDARKYFNELRVADQVTMDCSRSDDANRPAFLFHLGASSTVSARRNTITISSTSRSETIRLRSSPFRAITTPSWSQAPLRLESR